MAVNKKSEVPSVHRVPAHLARRFHQVCLGALAEVTTPDDISPLQYGIIASIQEQPGLDQRRLAERMGIDTVSAHHHINFLESRGLVARATDPNDRRSRVLKITPRGGKLRERLRPQITAAHERVLSALSNTDRLNFLKLLTRIIESNETYARPGNGRRRPPKRITELMH